MLLRTLVTSGLKSNKGTFIGLVFLMLLTSAILTFALCIYTDLNERQTCALSESNAGDILIISNSVELSDAFTDEVESLEKVDRVKVAESLEAPTSYQSPSGDNRGDKNMLNVTYTPWSEAIDFNIFEDTGNGTVELVSREKATPPDQGEIYVPIGTQTTLGLSLGDFVIISIGKNTHSLKITGFIEDPQLGSPFVELSQYLVSDEEFDQMYKETQALGSEEADYFQQAETEESYLVRTLNIYMTDEAKSAGLTPSKFAEYVNDNINTDTLSFGFLSAETLTGYAMLVVTIFCAVFLVFALLMYIIALVICIHTISSAIQENYANFAILKAVGIPNSTIRRSLVIQYVVCAAIGCIAGFAIGYALMTPTLLPMFARLTGVLAQNNAPSVLVYAALAILLLVIVAAVALKTKKIARISPLSALRSGLGDVHFKSRASISAAGRPLELRLAWRALVSAKRSYIGLFTCALMLAAFVMMTFGIGGSLRTMDDSYKAFGTWRSDVSVRLPDDIDIEEVKDVISEASPIKLMWQEGFSMQNMKGESRSIVGLSDFTVTSGISEGDAPSYNNEVVVGYKLAEYMGLSIGDKLMIADSAGTEHEYLVSGLLSAMFNGGYGILMTYDGLDMLGYINDVKNDSYQMILADSSKADYARELIQERFGDKVDTTNTSIFASTDDLMVLIHDMFIFIGYGMDVIAVLLAFLAVSLIIGRMFNMERRDLGIYRAIGFTARSLRLQFATRFLIVSLMGCIVATALICAGGSWLASQLFGTFGVTKFSIDTSPALIGSVAIGLALVFFIAAFWSARKVRNIPTSVLITE